MCIHKNFNPIVEVGKMLEIQLHQKNQSLALDICKVYHKIFLGYRNIFDDRICEFMLQYVATGKVQMDNIFKHSLCNKLFPPILTRHQLKNNFSFRHLYLSMFQINDNVSKCPLIENVKKKLSRKKLQCLEIPLNYSIKFSLGTGAQLMI